MFEHGTITKASFQNIVLVSVTGDHKMRSSDLLEAMPKMEIDDPAIFAFTFKQTLSAFMFL
jgi:hypothetical protein